MGKKADDSRFQSTSPTKMTFTKTLTTAAPLRMKLSDKQVGKCIHSLSLDVSETIENIGEFVGEVQLKDSPLSEIHQANVLLKRALAQLQRAEASTK